MTTIATEYKKTNTPKDLFTSKEHYLSFISAWKHTFNDPELRKQLTPAHFLLYAALRGKDWRKGFTPCTNKNKIDNGYAPYYSAYNALLSIHTATQASMWRAGMLMEPFNGTLTKEMLLIIGAMLPELKSTVINGKLCSGAKLPEIPYIEVK